MKVKELLNLISSLVAPEINIYDVKADKDFTCYPDVASNIEYCIDQFGERTIMKNSVVFGEHNDETPFLHFVVE